MQKERSHILVSVAPLGRSSEGSREQSVSWLAPASPVPPRASLGQKGRHRVQEDAQNLVPIPQGRLYTSESFVVSSDSSWI